MTSCLAFDTATSTGCAFGVAGGKPQAWTLHLGKADWPVRFSKLLQHVEHFIKTFDPDIVAVEAFVRGPKANPDLIGLAACVQGQAARMGKRIVTYHQSSIRAHFLGHAGKSRTPIKVRVFQRCRMLGWPVEDHDQADAVALWDFALSRESRSHQMSSVGGLFAEPQPKARRHA